MDINILKKIGFSDKSAQVYLGLLRQGPSSVRKLAEFCGFNRGSTYDALKWLGERGLVSFYEKDAKQHFVAEPPSKLSTLVRQEAHNLEVAGRELARSIPELEALHNRGGERPVARYFAAKEIPEILADVLDTCTAADQSEYFVYSAEGIRPYVYRDFSTFSDVRVGRGIKVKVIALGAGGELRGLDERKWLPASDLPPTYIIVYPGKTAYIALNTAGEAMGVVIENGGICATQARLFAELWQRLP